MSTLSDQEIRFSLLDLGGPVEHTLANIAEQSKQVASKPLPVTPQPKPDEVETVRAASVSQQLVAGAMAEGNGIIFAWRGHGELTLGQLTDLCTKHGLGHIVPEGKSNHALAARAIRSAIGSGFALKTLSKPRAASYAARWAWSTIDGKADLNVNDNAGQVAGVAQLNLDGTLVCDGTYATKIGEEYNRLKNGEVFSAIDITNWIASFVCRAGGIRLGTAQYLPSSEVKTYERFIVELSNVWGDDWLLPTPIATTEQLRMGLHRGLMNEYNDLLAELQAADRAAKERKAVGLGVRAAVSFVRKFTELQERAKGFALLVGAERVNVVTQACAEQVNSLSHLAGDTATRGAMLELD